MGLSARDAKKAMLGGREANCQISRGRLDDRKWRGRPLPGSGANVRCADRKPLTRRLAMGSTLTNAVAGGFRWFHPQRSAMGGLATPKDRFREDLECRLLAHSGSGILRRPPKQNGRRGSPAAAVLTQRREAPRRYSTILVTTPEPTVRPPSRMAKRSFSSMAIGVISSTASSALSPGMIISTPSFSLITPVTSVVRK